ncbi:MAG: ATP-binding protein [Elusimicrobia bacterium]|nr:ATP-binding protein [Elusimicrobiota bacterium]
MNPFNFGNIAMGRWFVDREIELKRLKRSATSGGKIMLISPRRYGKTSLAFKLKETLEKEKAAVVIYLDTMACASLKQFVDKYTSALANALESTVEKAWTFLTEILPTLRPQVQMTSGPEGSEVSVQIVPQGQDADQEKIFESILDLPEKTAVKRKKPVVIILDEFQAIREFDPTKTRNALLWKMRSKIQHHRHVGYVFAGSQKHILEQMVEPHDSPFFKMLDVLRLEKIDPTLFSEFIRRRFKEGGLVASAEVIARIITQAENIPFYVLNLSHELYEYVKDGRGKLDVPAVDSCVIGLAKKNHPQYESQWERLSGLQKNALKAISSGHKNNLFSVATLKKFEFGSVGGTQKALKSLLEAQHLHKIGSAYHFDDVWFKEWIKWKR